MGDEQVALPHDHPLVMAWARAEAAEKALDRVFECLRDLNNGPLEALRIISGYRRAAALRSKEVGDGN